MDLGRFFDGPCTISGGMFKTDVELSEMSYINGAKAGKAGNKGKSSSVGVLESFLMKTVCYMMSKSK